MSTCTEIANKKLKIWCKCLPARWVVLIMNFLGTFSFYGLRSNLSAAIVSMVDYEKLASDRNTQLNSRFQNESLQYNITKCGNYYINDEEKETSVAVDNKKFLWNENMQGLALACYFYGYICSQVIGAWLARKLGRVKVWGFSILLASTCTILIPLALEIGFVAFVAARIMIGFFSGVTYPIMFGMWTVWATPTERAFRMAASNTGGQVGHIVTLPLTGILATTFGWQSAFYITGTIGCVWSILWLMIVYNSPAEHPRISEEEKNLLLEHTSDGKTAGGRSRPIPWKSILGSYRVWVVFYVMFASDFIVFVFITMLPTYLKTVMNFNIKGSATLSSVPYIVKVVVAIFAGWFGDRLLLMGVRKTNVRKSCQSLAMFTRATTLIFAAYIECNVPLIMLAFTLCVGVQGFSVPGIDSTVVDMAPDFFGIVYSIGNTMSTSTGFLGPQIAGLLLTAYHNDPIQGWRILFWLATTTVTVGAILFLIFGTAEVQEWAKSDNDSNENKSKANKMLEGKCNA